MSILNSLGLARASQATESSADETFFPSPGSLRKHLSEALAHCGGLIEAKFTQTLREFSVRNIFGKNSFDHASLIGSGFHQHSYFTEAGEQLCFIKKPEQDIKRVMLVIPGRNQTASSYNFLDCPSQSTALMLLSYPGRGGCEGSLPSAESVNDSLKAALSEIPNIFNSSRAAVTLLAQSLGTGFTLRLAAAEADFLSRHGVDQIVLVSPYEDFVTQAKRSTEGMLNPFIPSAIDRFARFGFGMDNYQYITALAELNPNFRVLIFHGCKDQDIPINCSRELNSVKRSLTTFLPIKDAEHRNILENPSNRSRLFQLWKAWNQNRKFDF